MTKSGKYCGKRRNCTFWAISSFVTMFSKSRLLQRRQKASIWGKGLRGVRCSLYGGNGLIMGIHKRCPRDTIDKKLKNRSSQLREHSIWNALIGLIVKVYTAQQVYNEGRHSNPFPHADVCQHICSRCHFCFEFFVSTKRESVLNVQLQWIQWNNWGIYAVLREYLHFVSLFRFGCPGFNPALGCHDRVPLYKTHFLA